jgi:hypothetical protein
VPRLWITGPSASNVNSFAFIQPDLGTTPAADSPTDTLILTSSDSSITITGNSTTDTIDLVWNGAVAGDVVGPASSTDNAIVRFDGTTGKLIQNSAVQIDDTTGRITPTTSNANLIIDGNGTGVVQHNTGATSYQMPKDRPAGGTPGPFVLRSLPSTGDCSWYDIGSALLPYWQVVYDSSSITGEYFTVDNTNKGLRIRDAATPITGVLFAVRDNAETTNYFYVDSSGIKATNANVGQGEATYSLNGVTNTPRAQVADVNTGATNGGLFVPMASATTSVAPRIEFLRSEGASLSSPTGISGSGTILGQIRAGGYDGTSSYRTGALIRFESDGVYSATSTPGGIRFFTTTSGTATATQKLYLNNAGKLFFGSAEAASIQYSTNLIINPQESGSGFVYIGDGSTPRNLQAARMGLGTDAPSSVRIISANLTDSTVSTGMLLTLVHTGSTSAMRCLNFTATHSGSPASPSASSLFTSNHTVDPTGTVTMIGIQAQPGTLVANTQGTRLYYGFRAIIQDGGLTHTGGTHRLYGLKVNPLPSFSGGATVTGWAINVEDDIQVASDKKIIFEGSDTVKGDTYWVYDSGALEAQLWVNGVKVVGSTSTTVTSYVSTSGFGGNAVSVTVDFGSVGGGESDQVTTTVAAAWVGASTKIVCTPFAVTTADHDPDDYAAEEIVAYATNISAGVGFDVITKAPNGSFGQYVIHCVGV